MKKLKSFFALSVCAIILLLTISLAGCSQKQLTENDIDQTYEFAVSVLDEYYRSITKVYNDEQTDRNVLFEEKITPLVSVSKLGKYLCGKQKYLSEHSDWVASHKSEFKLIEYKVISGALYLKIAATITQTVNHEDTGYGEAVEMLIVFEKGQLKIADWYDNSSRYDEVTRGSFCTIDNPDFWTEAENYNPIFNVVDKEF